MEGLIVLGIFLYFGGAHLLSIPAYLLGKLVGLFVRVVKMALIGNEPREKKEKPKPAKEKPAKAKKEPKAKPVKRGKATLSHEQRMRQCSAIIEDSFEYKDDFLDRVAEGNSEAIYSVPTALKRSEGDYEAQFGDKKWTSAWLDALAIEFGTPFQYNGKGEFQAKKTA